MLPVSLGTFKQGEVPFDLTWTYRDSDGVVIPVTGYQVIAKAVDHLGAVTEIAGSIVDGPNGKVKMVWTAALTDTTGPWTLVVWVSNGTRVMASATIAYNVTSHAAPTFP